MSGFECSNDAAVGGHHDHILGNTQGSGLARQGNRCGESGEARTLDFDVKSHRREPFDGFVEGGDAKIVCTKAFWWVNLAGPGASVDVLVDGPVSARPAVG